MADQFDGVAGQVAVEASVLADISQARPPPTASGRSPGPERPQDPRQTGSAQRVRPLVRRRMASQFLAGVDLQIGADRLTIGSSRWVSLGFPPFGGRFDRGPSGFAGRMSACRCSTPTGLAPKPSSPTSKLGDRPDPRTTQIDQPPWLQDHVGLHHRADIVLYKHGQVAERRARPTPKTPRRPAGWGRRPGRVAANRRAQL